MPIFVLLILFFALELALFIEWGSQLGVLVTLAEIFLTAVVGVQVIRMTGIRFVQELPLNLHNRLWLQVRKQVIMRRILASLLLIMPGFATDILGVILMVWSLFGSRDSGANKHQHAGPRRGASGKTIEGEYEDASAERKKPENERIP